MWKLIDYRTEYRSNGCDIQQEEMYMLENTENKNMTRWVNEYDYKKMVGLGLLRPCTCNWLP